MCSNMKSYYFSAHSKYKILSGRGSANTKKFTWMHLKVFKVYLFIHSNVSHLFIHLITFILSWSAISNMEIVSVVTM